MGSAASKPADRIGADPASACAPISAAPLERPTAERIAHLLKAIADPARLQLLSLIQAAPGGEACVCDLVEPLGLRQPTVSHHLRVLSDAGILRREKRATWVWYSMAPGGLDAVLRLLK
jgi:ArsR family transcriptional regulator, arsenate/arsenite/antimonite-responsive transcriptional repressor